ncbi:MAG: hypothetical protein DRI90_05140 [Deltaproteobacteria bacterium]|nr:MAG: hypothetical protein DRI90_05140 [Deltaproteobacteria bacterium]
MDKQHRLSGSSPRFVAAAAVIAATWVVCACGDEQQDGPTGGAGGAAGGSTTSTSGGSSPGGGGGSAGSDPCPRDPAPANRERRVVISHPYDAQGGQDGRFEVLALSEGGQLSATGTTFEMGRAFEGVITFTSDGLVGVAVHDDGTLGVFGWDEQDQLQVIHDSYEGSFYADSVVMDPTGSRLFVLDNQWREHGGGVYRLRIECDGTLVEETKLFEAKLPAALLFDPLTPDRAVVAAKDAFSSPLDLDAHLLAWGGNPSWVTGSDAFPDDEASIGAAAITPDGHYALLGDNSAFSGLPNRVAVVQIGADSLTVAQVLSPLEDPYAIVASPFGNAALVVSGFGEELFVLDYDSDNAASPFSIAGTVSYQGGSPGLPGKAVLIERGDLEGRVLVAEYNGVRQVSFQPDGTATDHGLSTFGSGSENNVGAIGVQP